jgi:hypothetical protein
MAERSELDDPLNLMRVMPPKGGPTRLAVSAVRFPRMAFFKPRITRMETDKIVGQAVAAATLPFLRAGRRGARPTNI